ncbi:helix-turn-helix transcriptional regulator [Pseudophaeobacter sp. 1A16562]|uniref:helix-turn-helix domain-containing protein n=1 Tax=Pseudophaeobacter sp. 1A16562 TaxID=3098143 RepID=UPI0034D50F7E
MERPPNVVLNNYMASNPTPDPFLSRLQAAIDADPDLNVSNLATKAGLSNSTIRLMFRHNKSPRVATMRKICAALGTTLEEFMSSAQTAEEQEIVRLFAQLPEPLKQQLLGYGRGLAAAADRPQPEAAEEKE